MLFLRFPPAIQNVISSYQIFGLIPLDKTLHVLIGMLITVILRSKKVRMLYVFLIIGSLEVLKEVNDYFVLNSTLQEQVMDILATFLYPTLILIIIKIKENASHSK